MVTHAPLARMQPHQLTHIFSAFFDDFKLVLRTSDASIIKEEAQKMWDLRLQPQKVALYLQRTNDMRLFWLMLMLLWLMNGMCWLIKSGYFV